RPVRQRGRRRVGRGHDAARRAQDARHARPGEGVGRRRVFAHAPRGRLEALLCRPRPEGDVDIRRGRHLPRELPVGRQSHERPLV
ncbi:hypothetical protein E4U53_002550, partial [Claviceps sorghi]